MPVKRTNNLKGIEAKLENATKRGLIAWAMLVAQRATQKAPVLTGRLKRSITHTMPVMIARMAWEAYVGTNIEYSAVQELGSGLYGPKKRKYLITPKRASVLAFEWMGKQRFFKHVWHPGVKSQPYLRPALNETKREGTKLLLTNILAAFKK
jgi:phage gpG-like protein